MICGVPHWCNFGSWHSPHRHNFAKVRAQQPCRNRVSTLCLEEYGMGSGRTTETHAVPSKRTRKSVVASNLVEDSNLPNHERVIEKDETEEKLEKLIFGDDAGFLDSLKADTTGQELLRISNSSGEGEHSGSDKDLHEAADKDVRSALMLRTDA